MGTFPPRPISGLQLNSDKRAEVETLQSSVTQPPPACSPEGSHPSGLPPLRWQKQEDQQFKVRHSCRSSKPAWATRDPVLPQQEAKGACSNDVLGTSPTTGKLDHQCLCDKDPPRFISTGHWSHGLLTQPGQKPSHLQQGVHTFRHFHVSVSNLLDEFQFQVFSHRKGFTHSENVANDILW